MSDSTRVSGATAHPRRRWPGPKSRTAILYPARTIKIRGVVPIVRKRASLQFPAPSPADIRCPADQKASTDHGGCRFTPPIPLPAGPDRLEVHLINTTAKPIEAVAPSRPRRHCRRQKAASPRKFRPRGRSFTPSRCGPREQSVRSTGLRSRCVGGRRARASSALLAPPVINGDFETDAKP